MVTSCWSAQRRVMGAAQISVVARAVSRLLDVLPAPVSWR